MHPGSPTRRRAGFTMVELGVVILIIGIMMSFLLVASFEGLKRANERATQSLIQRLDLALTDRIEALSSQRPEPNNAHRYLAMSVVPDPSAPRGFRLIESEARARLIAQIDYIKRELPDVFFVQGNAGTPYPLNFAGVPFEPGSLDPEPPPVAPLFGPLSPYVLPLGHAYGLGAQFDPDSKTFLEGPGLSTALGDMSGLGPSAPRFTSPRAGQGIYGASYSAIGSLMRLLGDYPFPDPGNELGPYPARGFNGIDDDGDGRIDEFTASELGLSAGAFARLQSLVNQRLDPVTGHKHITARSEMLYAILVGGVGPLGSVFSPDDFTDREVRDTDNDGLPEFVDAWGQPLQFYRWPIYFSSELGVRSLQKGEAPYGGLTEPREENPLDPNQLLVAPGWWSNLANLPGASAGARSANISNRANQFSRHFFSLVDPYADDNTYLGGGHWDRTSFYRRRAYYFKPLILSAGPDRQYGVGSFGLSYSTGGQTPDDALLGSDPITRASRMILIENQASRSDPFMRIEGDASLFQEPPAEPDSLATFLLRSRWGVDDITNHAPNTLGSGGR